MGLTVAIQMDPVGSINFDTDSTLMLGLEALSRGYTLYYFNPNSLSLADGKVVAQSQRLELRPVKGDHFRLGPSERLSLDRCQVVLVRQDPPFDLAYITATYLLERLPPTTVVVNNPTQIRNSPEKLMVTQFRDLVPPTLISSTVEEIATFRQQHGAVVIKPLYGFGGFGVVHLEPDDRNLPAILELHAARGREPLVIQKYIADVRTGDKRIILVNGKPIGAVLRQPAEHETRANFHAGGRPVKSDLTSRDKEICAVIGPILVDRGLLLAGIDVIGGYLIEINVTCPTGIQEINRLNDARLEAIVWDAIDAEVERVGRAG
ncbi:glutathione synthase [Taklimakanibacter deserti]|uniref:glutathione synthase n=1 Tax=Taklimakanibacter deserti TaxID=2267839 RepID=UPI000E653158